MGAWIETIVGSAAMAGAVGAFDALIAGWTMPKSGIAGSPAHPRLDQRARGLAAQSRLQASPLPA